MAQSRYGEIRSVQFYFRVGSGPTCHFLLEWLAELNKARDDFNGPPCWEKERAPGLFQGAELFIRFVPGETASTEEAAEAFRKVVLAFDIGIRSYPNREPGMSYIFLESLFGRFLEGKDDGRFKVLGLDLDDPAVITQIGGDPNAFFGQHLAQLLDSAV